jgi:hypothetical protein
MFSKVIHVAACIRISFLFIAQESSIVLDTSHFVFHSPLEMWVVSGFELL